MQADVTDQERMKVVVEEVEEKYGPIQTLVYNAGNGVWKKYNELTVKELETCFAVNTSGLLTAANYSRANSNYVTVSPIEEKMFIISSLIRIIIEFIMFYYTSHST